LTKLWHIAVHEQLINPISSSREEHDKISKDDLDSYQQLIDNSIPHEIIEILCNWKNLICWINNIRSLLPYILLSLLITIMCMSYLSYDLHPLACIIATGELITYEKNRVDLEFSDTLLTFQKVNVLLVFTLGIIFLVCVYLFFHFTQLVVEDL